jgi:amidohydrolase
MSLLNSGRQALKLAAAVEAEAIALRREIHRYPEIGYEEVRTTGLIMNHLQNLGLDVWRPPGSTGAIARLTPRGPAGRRPGIALRADIDALPIDEKTDLAFKSRVPGRAHLCGHDAHTAMLLGAASALSGARIRHSLPCPVTFIFQPAEECIPNGAPIMIAAGALEGVKEIFALHVSTARPVGSLALRVGPMMAAMDRFDMTINGKGGHGAIPHNTNDPVVASAAVISALQTIASRKVSPLDPVVVSVCTLEAGGAFNVIPDRVVMSGTARSLNSEVHARLPELIKSTAVAAARTQGCRVRCSYNRGTPVLVNALDQVERMRAAWGGLVKAGAATDCADFGPIMGGEDFAYYLQEVPGALAFLGAAPKKPAGEIHNPKFVINERAMVLGIATHVSLVLEG